MENSRFNDPSGNVDPRGMDVFWSAISSQVDILVALTLPLIVFIAFLYWEREGQSHRETDDDR
jgi:hypothetical protein